MYNGTDLVGLPIRSSERILGLRDDSNGELATHHAESRRDRQLSPHAARALADPRTGFLGAVVL